MWRLLSATLRERKRHVEDVQKSASTAKRFQHHVALQLDYYMSPQFAGLASALVNNSYSSLGIDIKFLPTCPVGLEQERVRLHQKRYPHAVTVGIVEQNIFIPTLAANPHLKTTAVAAMFHQSPLCIASLPNENNPSDVNGMKIGVHEDTVELMKRIFPKSEVVASPRSTKNTDLLKNTFDGIQAYTTTEVPALSRALGEGVNPNVTLLEGLNGAKLGYSQVLFAADECLSGDRRDVVKKFCKATFDGWKYAIHHPEQAVKQVREAKKMLGLDDENNDHWVATSEFELEMLMRCNDFVKGTFEGDRHGVIDPSRWCDATDWMLEGKDVADDVGTNFGFDPDVWKPPSNLLSGNRLARKTLDEAKKSAMSFRATFGRNPSLAVITVGNLERYKHSDRRLQIYSSKLSSWFSKSSTGEANCFDVEEINLKSTTTTDELLSKIYSLDHVDGIQLMWPLPEHIDSARVYSAIKPSQDVDGIHYIGQLEIGNKDAYPPVTPAATIALMDEFGVKVEGKRVLLIGRSPITGSPIAHMLREKGGAVTVVHSKVSTQTIEALVGEADVIVCCAGSPGTIKAEWIKGADVINVGTTFDEELDSLIGDVDGDIALHASRYSPIPGGIGPLSTPMLFKNVSKAAWKKIDGPEAVLNSGWERSPSALRKKFHFDSYTEAIDAANKVDEISTTMDHHANMKFTHKCVKGVNLEMEFFTYEAKEVTEKDYDAAKAVDMLLSEDKIEMSKYSYNLDEKSIAKYPASPRGSSKLLRVDSSGTVTRYNNFSSVFASLAKDCHIVFNDSRVLNARMFVQEGNKNVEVMILDLGAVNIQNKCTDTPLQVMLRKQNVQVGDVFEESKGQGNIEVVEIKG